MLTGSLVPDWLVIHSQGSHAASRKWSSQLCVPPPLLRAITMCCISLAAVVNPSPPPPAPPLVFWCLRTYRRRFPVPLKTTLACQVLLSTNLQ
jgi:hypothetical protein